MSSTIKNTKQEIDQLFSFDIASILIFVFIGPSILLWHIFDRLKLIYLSPFVFVFLIFVFLIFKNPKSKNINISKSSISMLILYLIIAIIPICISDQKISWNTIIRDILIFSTPIIIFCTNMVFQKKHVVFLFIIMVLSYLFYIEFNVSFELINSLIYSKDNSPSEFHTGIIFGLFFIYFLLNKNYFWLISSLIFIFLVSKRAIFLGLIPSTIVYYLVVNPNSHKSTFIFIILLIYYFVFFIIASNLIEISDFMVKNIFEGTTTQKFLMSRDMFIKVLEPEIFNSDYWKLFFGHGPGQSDSYLQFRFHLTNPWIDTTKPVNPHNDFLKLSFDYGIIGTSLYFFVLYDTYVRNNSGTYIFLYTIPLFLVDNSLIFVYYLIIACVIANTETKALAIKEKNY